MAITYALGDEQADLLLTATDTPTNTIPATLTGAASLARVGLLTRTPAGYQLTDSGRRIAADLTQGRAAAIIGRHLDGPDRHDRATAAAADLGAAGHLLGGNPHPDTRTLAAAILSARHDGPTADRITNDLADAHLLAGTWTQEH